VYKKLNPFFANNLYYQTNKIMSQSLVNEFTTADVVASTTSTIPKFTDREKARYARQKDKTKFKTPEEEWTWSSTQSEPCAKCGCNQPLSSYPGNTCGSDAFYSTGLRRRRLNCRACLKKDDKSKNDAVALAKTLGISYKAPEGSSCTKCHREPKKGNGLVFDHDHVKGTFRGYLCDSCNRSIGVLGDNPAGLVEALNYILKTDPKRIVQLADGSLTIVEENDA